MSLNFKFLYSVVGVSILVLSGCSLSPSSEDSQYRLLSDEKYITEGGSQKSVRDLQEDYFKETGNSLSKPTGLLSCGWDSLCYYSKWASEYDSKINAIRSAKKQERDNEYAKCTSDPVCYREREVNQLTAELNNSYAFIVFPSYNQASADAFFRETCTSSGIVQQKGVSLDELISKVKSAPGLAPAMRAAILPVVQTCWKLSSLGVKDGNVKLRY